MRATKTCKNCRRLGVSLCGREKCALKRKPYPPGVHGKAFRRASSEFGSQLKEKQKVKFLYGLREQQFKNYILDAISQHKVATGEAIVNYLEMRLDNVVYRLGLLPTRAAARQAVNHGHILVNGKHVNIPSHRLKVGDSIEINPARAQKGLFANLAIQLKKYSPPEWLTLDSSAFKGKVVAPPVATDLIKSYNISAIVEYYSR